MPISPASCALVPFALGKVKVEMCKAPFDPQINKQRRKCSSPVAPVMPNP